MIDLSGWTALDVAIGLAFLFFLLSIVTSAVNEFIASLFAWRAVTLEEAIRKMLTDEQADAFLRNPRIRILEGKRPWLKTQVNRLRRRPAPGPRKPSYIPARDFALTVLDTMAPETAERLREQDPDEPASRNVIKSVQAEIDQIQNESIKRVLSDALGEARVRIDALRTALEREFDASMDRASGWYKRRVQYFLMGIAVVVTCAFNADAFQVGSRLATDEAVRAAVVQRAVSTAEDQGSGSTETSDPASDLQATEEELNDVADSVADVNEIGIPLGWSEANVPEITGFWDGFFDVLGKAGGLLVTIFAISLGAPFWFDVLGKFAHLRSTGNREGTAKDPDRAAVDRDERG